MGPFEFNRIYGTQQHDVYMQGFLVYGWLGGAAYLTMVVVTLAVGFKAALIRSPWQTTWSPPTRPLSAKLSKRSSSWTPIIGATFFLFSV